MRHFALCGTAQGNFFGGGGPEKFLGPVEFRGGEFHGAAPPTGGPEATRGGGGQGHGL